MNDRVFNTCKVTKIHKLLIKNKTYYPFLLFFSDMVALLASGIDKAKNKL